MHYLFFDESYKQAKGQTTIVVAAWAIEQLGLNRFAEHLSELYRPPVLERIDSVLNSLDAQAVVGSATLDATIFRPGEIDGTNDVAAMARTDNIWSQCLIFLVGALIERLLRRGQEVGTIDIHFDPKSLKRDHFEAIERTLGELLVSEAKRYAYERGSKLLKRLKIRRFQPVTKPSGGRAPDKFQMGTWVADKLCSNFDRIRKTRHRSRIQAFDMSDVVRRTVQQFDGKSFYENPS